VSTSDGRVKILGREGVERTLHTGAHVPSATRQLLFLLNRGALARVGGDGRVELCAVDADEPAQEEEGGAPRGAPLAALELPGGDHVTAAAAMHQEPYVQLGCSSGAVRVAGLVNASGAPVTEARQVRGQADALQALSRPISALARLARQYALNALFV